MTILNERGAGLLQVIIGSAVIGLLSISFSRYHDVQLKAMNRIEAKSNIDALATDLRSVLMTGTSCSSVLGTTQTFGTGERVVNLQYDAQNLLRSEPNVSQSSTPILQELKLRAQRIYLAAGSTSAGASATANHTSYKATLMGEFQSTIPVDGANYFEPVELGEVLLNVNNANNRINGCSDGASGALAVDLCAEVGGTYDVRTKRCSFDSLISQRAAQSCRASGGTPTAGGGCNMPQPSGSSACSQVGGSMSGGACILSRSSSEAYAAIKLDRLLGSKCGKCDAASGVDSQGRLRCKGYGKAQCD